MSGYAYKTPYDATVKRKQYLQELALRAKLDDVNLQANKIYKRTGAVSTPPDTRTTTEKLSDLYRLRIEVRSKLGQIMSGDDAQKVVNELDQQELIFLTQRIDKFIAELKPKYALGVPYQVFNTYFKNAIKSYNSIGDIDMTSLTLLENMPTKDDLDNALFQVERLLTTAGQRQERRMLSGFMMMYSKLMTEIQNNRNIISSGQILDPLVIQAIEDLNSDVAQNLPSGTEIQQLEADIQQLESGVQDPQLINSIKQRLSQYDALMKTIENSVEEVKIQREKILKPKSTIPAKSTRVARNVEGLAYIDPSIDLRQISFADLKQYMVISKKIALEQGRDGDLKRLKLNAPTNFRDKTSIVSKLQEQEVNDFMKEIWTEAILVPSQTEQLLGARPPPAFAFGGQQAFSNVRLRPTKPTAPTIDPTLGANLNQQQGSGAPNLTGINPTPPTTPNIPIQPITNTTPITPIINPMSNLSGQSSSGIIYPKPIKVSNNRKLPDYKSGGDATKIKLFKKFVNTFSIKFGDSLSEYIKNNLYQQLTDLKLDDVYAKSGDMPLFDISEEIIQYVDYELVFQIRTAIDRGIIQDGNIDETTDKFKKYCDLVFGYIIEKIGNVSSLDDPDTLKQAIKDIDLFHFPIWFADYSQKNITGGKLKGKKSRMKGKGVAIDPDAGMIADGERKSNYVPFGKFIINRNKLNDGIIMIKRPNGAFMGELQSRRVGSKLRNIFEKIVGGSVPSYNDYNKLDADEIEYLHFVAKKSNLLDKLDVPTPKKDDDEKIQHRFEVLKGMIFSGNDNKQMIDEFKKLILDMSDRKLLPRRQVSDIIIELSRVYG
jgi:hypothetical protein